MSSPDRPRRMVFRLAGGRRAHVVMRGAGPPVLLIHESPRSARVLAPLARTLASDFTAIALDTPGYGLSDPLILACPEITDYAAGVLEVMDALGIERAGIYGVHTGAQIAAELVANWPECVAATIADGFPVFSPQERAETLAAYLPPFRADWMGTHVAWAWARVRDQSVFFPWYQAGDGARLGYGPAPLTAVQEVVQDLFAAGDGYRVGYAAAFRQDPHQVLQRIGAEILLATREDDMLFGHLERSAPWPKTANIRRLPAGRDAAGIVFRDYFRSRLSDLPPFEASVSKDGILRDSQDGQVWVDTHGPADAPPLLMLHDLPGGPSADADLAQRLSAHFRVWQIALPGTAQSARPSDWTSDLDKLAGTLAGCLAEARGATVLGLGASAAIAVRLASELGGEALLLDPQPELPNAAQLEEAAPDMTPCWDGGHLHALWWALRDAAIYYPAWKRDFRAARPLGPDVDVARLARQFAEAVNAGEPGMALARACLSDNEWRSESRAKSHALTTVEGLEPAFPSVTEIAPGAAAIAEAVLHHARGDGR